MAADPGPRRGAGLWGLALGAAVLAIYAGFWVLARESAPCRDLTRALPQDLAALPGRSCEAVDHPQTLARARITIPAEYVEEVATHLTDTYGAEPLVFACCGDEAQPAGQYDIPAEILPAEDGARPVLRLFLSVPWLDDEGEDLPPEARHGQLVIELVRV